MHIMKMCCYVFHYSRLDVLYVHVGAKITCSPVQFAENKTNGIFTTFHDLIKQEPTALHLCLPKQGRRQLCGEVWRLPYLKVDNTKYV